MILSSMPVRWDIGEGGAGEWEAYVARRLNIYFIVYAQKVSNKEWEVTSLTLFSTSSSMSIAREDGRNYFKEEG